MSEISKKKLNEYLTAPNKYVINLHKDDGKDFDIRIKGQRNKMKKNSFENIVLEFIKDQRAFNQQQIDFNQKVDNRLDKIENRLDVVDNRLDKIENRLDVVEQDLQLIKSLPTIKQEIKQKKK